MRKSENQRAKIPRKKIPRNSKFQLVVWYFWYTEIVGIQLTSPVRAVPGGLSGEIRCLSPRAQPVGKRIASKVQGFGVRHPRVGHVGLAISRSCVTGAPSASPDCGTTTLRASEIPKWRVWEIMGFEDRGNVVYCSIGIRLVVTNCNVTGSRRPNDLYCPEGRGPACSIKTESFDTFRALFETHQ